MTHLDKGKFAKKHGPDQQPAPEITEAVKGKARAREISCGAAFEIVAGRGVSPADVGLAIDCLEVSIVKCQLGLFGYGSPRRIVKPAAEVPRSLEDRIRSALVEERLPCATAWSIAADLNLTKMDVSSACERLGTRISTCQLGAF